MLDYEIMRPILLLIIIFFLLAGSCTRSIRSVNTKAEAFAGKKVKVQGEVISALSLINFRSFALRDKSGTIWVLTNQLLPHVGEEVRISGRVIPSYTYNKEKITVIDARQGNFVFYEKPIIKK